MTSQFRLFCYLFRRWKRCRNCVYPGTKRSKTAIIVSAGQTWARLEKEYIHSDWTSDTKIWMAGGQGGYLSPRKISFFLLSYKLFKNGWVTVLLFLHNCNIKKFNMHVYNILKLIVAQNCRYKLNHCINNTNILDHILLIVHPTIR